MFPLVVFGGLTLAAQTQIDLRTQAKNIDFSAANSTRPFKTGTALPTACAPGGLILPDECAAGGEPIRLHGGECMVGTRRDFHRELPV